MVHTRKRKYDEEHLIEKRKSKSIPGQIGSSNSVKKKFISTRSNKVLSKSNVLNAQIKSKKLGNQSSVKEYKKKNGKIIKVEVRKESKYDNESSNDSGIFLNNSTDLSCGNSILSSNEICDDYDSHESIANKQHNFKDVCSENNLKTLQVVLVRMEHNYKNVTEQRKIFSNQQSADLDSKCKSSKHVDPLCTTTNLNSGTYSHKKTENVSQDKKMSSGSKLCTVGYKLKSAKVIKSRCSRANKLDTDVRIESSSIVTRKRSLDIIENIRPSDISKVSKLEIVQHSHKLQCSDTANRGKISKKFQRVKDFKSINKSKNSNDIKISRDVETSESSASVTDSTKTSKLPDKRKNFKAASKLKNLDIAKKSAEPNNDENLRQNALVENLKFHSIEKCSESADKLKTSNVVENEDGTSKMHNSKVWDLVNEFENKSDIVQGTSTAKNNYKELNLSDESSGSDSEWEEVEEKVEENLEDYKPDILQEGVEITIAYKDRKKEKMKVKRERELEYARLNVNKIRRNNQLLVHKVHLLCLLARGFHLNKILNSPVLQAIALSFIPNEIISKIRGKKVEKINVSGLRDIMLWFCKSFSYAYKCDFFSNMFLNIVKSFQSETAVNVSYYNLMFIVIARVLGFKARFCMSLYPVSFKAQNLLKRNRNINKTPAGTANANCQAKPNVDTKPNVDAKPNVDTAKEKKVVSIQRKKSSNKSNKKKESNCLEKRPRLRKSIKKSYKISDDESDDSFKDEDFIASDVSSEDSDNEDGGNQIMEERSPKNHETMLINSIGKNKSKLKERTQRKNLIVKSSDISEDESDVDDFVPIKSKRGTKCNTGNKKRQYKKKNSSECNTYSYKSFYESDRIICWTEIFSKTDRRWISVDCVNKVIGNSYEFEALAHQPVSYVIAYDNDSYVKDVTSRYCNDFMIATRKLRVASEWWTDTIKLYHPPHSKINMEEDDEMDMTLIHKPIPQTLVGLKDHPLYALKRHLLKFEALYPPDAAPVGFLRGEPIYPRDCVCQLQSREKWFKNSRVVRPGEEPYKMSTQLKWDKINRVILKDVPLELFGFWQTDPYQPPVAKDGKIPRNEYGNVELFRGNMLPVGTVHIQIPGINRIAQKLDIDCCAAVVGFELTKGFIRPKFDGFVVCEEFKDTLINAWEEQQKLAKEKQREKNEKRIYGNWKKLIRGLLIRERLKMKYHLN